MNNRSHRSGIATTSQAVKGKFLRPQQRLHLLQGNLAPLSRLVQNPQEAAAVGPAKVQNVPATGTNNGMVACSVPSPKRYLT